MQGRKKKGLVSTVCTHVLVIVNYTGAATSIHCAYGGCLLTTITYTYSSKSGGDHGLPGLPVSRFAHLIIPDK